MRTWAGGAISRVAPCMTFTAAVALSIRCLRFDMIVVSHSNVGKSHSISALLDKNLCRSEEHTSELQSLMRISYAVFCLKKKKYKTILVQTTMYQYNNY